MGKNQETLVRQQFADLSRVFNKLRLSQDVTGKWVVRGELRFQATYEETSVDDSFNIEIVLPADYPRRPPEAREVGKRIPTDYHQFKDGRLCLGAPLDIRRKFDQCPTLKAFVETLLIPYLFSFSVWGKTGRMPYGELPHGGEGLFAYYCELFNVHNADQVLGLLGWLGAKACPSSQSCPCGSGKAKSKCHAKQISSLKNSQSKVEFLSDAFQIWGGIPEKDRQTIMRNSSHKHLLKAFRKQKQKCEIRTTGKRT